MKLSSVFHLRFSALCRILWISYQNIEKIHFAVKMIGHYATDEQKL